MSSVLPLRQTAKFGRLVVFYVFDEANARLIVLTSKTKHGGMMSRSAKVAGTIAGQPDSITKISGVQFAATAAL